MSHCCRGTLLRDIIAAEAGSGELPDSQARGSLQRQVQKRCLARGRFQSVLGRQDRYGGTVEHYRRMAALAGSRTLLGAKSAAEAGSGAQLGFQSVARRQNS